MIDLKQYVLSELAAKRISQEEAVAFLRELKNKNTGGRDIAVIGLGARLPMAESPDEFWDNLLHMRNCFTAIGRERARITEPYRNPHYAEFVEMPPTEDNLDDTLEQTLGAFISDVDKFDSSFFGIPPKEAKYIDPTQRIFMEVAWEAIEDAGYGVNRIQDTNTGIFVGKDYTNTLNYKYITAPDSMKMTGTWEGILASRLSYAFNLKGPAMVIDTACSSGLVALHEACNALRSGECEMALAGGVAVGAGSAGSAEQETGISGLGAVTAKDQRVRTFDKKSSGSVFGEGVVAFLLKPLAAAQRDKDIIYAVIKGSAINCDGKSSGITSPNPLAQEDVIVEAWKRAGVQPDTIDYVEAHGTGTLLGDPIEVQGLSNAFARFTEKKQFCGIGSVKTNIGHLVAASGCASLLKVVLALRHKTLPPMVNFEEPNPHISFADSPLYIVDRPLPWAKSDHPRRAGISSFGFSGTNVHMIVEEYEAPVSRPSETQELFLLSAKSNESLQRLLQRYCHFLPEHKELSLRELCYTAALGRGHYEYRIATLASSTEELAHKLQSGQFLRGSYRLVSERQSYKTAGELTEAQRQTLTQEAQALLQSKPDLSRLATLYVQGAQPDWTPLFGKEALPKVSLPPYAFARSLCWGEPKVTKIESGAQSYPHPLISACLADSAEQTIYELPFSCDKPWVVREHKIIGQNIVPGTAYLEAAVEAAQQYFHTEQLCFTSVVFRTPLVLRPEMGTVKAHLVLNKKGEELQIYVASLTDSQDGLPAWVKHMEASISAADEAPQTRALSTQGKRIEFALPEEERDDSVYLGAHWRCVEQMRQTEDGILARMQLPMAFIGELSSYRYHPSLTDAALNLPIQATAGAELYLPYVYRGLHIYDRIPGSFYSRVERIAGSSGADTMTYRAEFVDENGRLLASIDEYVTKKVTELSSYTANEFYQMQWLPWQGEIAPAPETGCCLVFGNDRAFLSALHGRKVYQVQQADGFARLTDGSFTVGTRQEDYDRLLDAIGESNIPTVYHLWTAEQTLQTTTDHYDTALGSGLLSLIYLTRSMQRKLRGKAHFVLVSRLAHPIFEVGNPHGAALLSLAKTLQAECTGYSFQCIDADEGALPLELLLGRTDTLLLACRKGDFYCPTLTQLSMEEAQAPQRGEGVCLITGGTGALGLELAGFLGSAWKRPVCLIGHSPLPSEDQWDSILEEGANDKLCRQITKLRQLRKDGICIELAFADCCDLAQMTAIVEKMQAKYGRIAGVFHLAGVAGDGFLYQKSDEQLHRVLRPKMLGAMTLYEALQGAKPDCFVMYSSMQTAMGGAGQGDYTAANTFMDVYAAYLRSQGLQAYAINWPAWSEVGMAADYQIDAATMLFASLPTRQAMAALDRILSHEIANLIPGKVNVDFLAQVGEENLPFALSKRLSANLRVYRKQTAAPTQRTAHSTENLQILGKETFTETEIRTAHIYAAVLSIDEIDIYASFNSLGGNSIIATDLIEVLNGEFDNLLNVSDIFSYPSIEEMAAHIDALRKQTTPKIGQEDILARFESGDLAVDEMLDYFKEDSLQ